MGLCGRRGVGESVGGGTVLASLPTPTQGKFYSCTDEAKHTPEECKCVPLTPYPKDSHCPLKATPISFCPPEHPPIPPRAPFWGLEESRGP